MVLTYENYLMGHTYLRVIEREGLVLLKYTRRIHVRVVHS